jgi:hypothetical protein
MLLPVMDNGVAAGRYQHWTVVLRRAAVEDGASRQGLGFRTAAGSVADACVVAEGIFSGVKEEVHVTFFKVGPLL